MTAILEPRNSALAETAAAPEALREFKVAYERDGYGIVRGMLSPAEVEEIREMFRKIHDEGVPGHYEPGGLTRDAKDPTDPLYHYPRVMMPHRYNPRARHYMLHPKVLAYLEMVFEHEPVATQSMFFYKPPGARGQAMHQDNFYLMVEPGTCCAAWTAIDDADAENGAMLIVPQTHEMEIVCPEEADFSESFTKHFVPVPKGKKPVMATMKAGDTLIFNGSAIHGSGPNRSKTRFRRSFISHYASGDLGKISRHYLPLVRMDGSDFEVEKNEGGGPCGVGWHGGLH